MAEGVASHEEAGTAGRGQGVRGARKPAKRAARRTTSPGSREEDRLHPEQEEGAFLIVAIGASAGGLEAFSELLKALPEDTGMAFVYIQHLDPSHKSMLSEILSKSTPMPTREAADGMTVEPDNVYVIPPNASMDVFHDTLLLMPRKDSPSPHKPVDHFFRSLAEDRKAKAIGIILSGTASDGSLGVRAIKEQGGITIAQDTASAKHEGMPRSAAATGLVDLVLPPREIAAELARLAKHPYLAGDAGGEWGTRDAPGEIPLKIFAILRSSTGVDFAGYKRSTITRRITRRMVLLRLESLDGYLRYLQENAGEVDNLFRDLLINVTSFFRSPEQFDALEKMVFPKVVKGKKRNNPVRIWVPGCATGEEAYSIAIAVQEYLERAKLARDVGVQIFATDVSEESIARARKGVYGENIADDVSPERLSRFFTRRESTFEIKKHIRDICVFAQHDLTGDPPFSHMDLISIRNLLIYFSPSMQKKTIPILHYALNPGGFLMLGTSESIGRFDEIFNPVDKKMRIYARRASTASTPASLAFPARAWEPGPAGASLSAAAPPRVDPVKKADEMLIARYAPLGILVDAGMNIIHIRGSSARYIELPPGKASLNILKLARGNLKLELRALMNKVAQSSEPARKEGMRLDSFSGEEAVDIEVIPLKHAGDEERHFLILFEEAPAYMRLPSDETAGEAGRAGEAADSGEARIEELERELASAREHMQATVEEHEAAIEELKAAGEEILSANEELQSTNEEYETAKEELQSSNEELTTLNEELASRNTELRLTSDDLLNVLASINIPVAIIRSDLTISRYTPKLQEIFNVKPSDLGRPVDDLRPRVDLPELREVILEVTGALLPKSMEVRGAAGRWYELEIRPYKTMENKIDGVVMTFMDITNLKHELDLLKDFYEPVLDTVRVPLVVLDSRMTVVRANRSFYRTFRAGREETEGTSIFEVSGRQWDIPRLRELLEKTVPRNTRVDDFEVEHEFESIGKRTMLLNARQVERKSGDAPLVLLSIEDVTERGRSEERLQRLNRCFLELGFDPLENIEMIVDAGEEILGGMHLHYSRREKGKVYSYVATGKERGFTPLASPGERACCAAIEEERTEPLALACITQQDYGRFPEEVSREGLRSYADQPIILGGRVVGCLCLFFLEASDLGPEERGLLGVLARAIEVEEGRLAREEELRDFIDIASHELRHPMTIIKGYASTLGEYRDGIDEETRGEALANIEKGVDRLERLVYQFLDTARIGRSKTVIVKREVDPVILCEKVVQEMSGRIPGSDILLRLEKEPGRIRADSEGIFQVLVILIENAVNYSPEGSSVEVVVSRLDESGLQVSVLDRGPGVPQEDREKIFDRFYQVGDVQHHSLKGIGLGLYIARDIVEAHGGRIWSESREGGGSIFRFNLPV